MTIKGAEKWARRAGAAGAFVSLGTVYWGLWKGSRHPKGRVSGGMPTFLRGPFWFPLATGILFMVLMLALWKPLRPKLPAGVRGLALIFGALTYFPGLVLVLWGRLALGEMYGVSSSLGVQLYADHRLVTSGPYALVRHPMYLGAQLAALGSLLLYRTWATLFLALVFPGLAVRARREEAALEAEFGETWDEYARSVPGWIPRLRGNIRLHRGRRPPATRDSRLHDIPIA